MPRAHEVAARKAAGECTACAKHAARPGLSKCEACAQAEAEYERQRVRWSSRPPRPRRAVIVPEGAEWDGLRAILKKYAWTKEDE